MGGGGGGWGGGCKIWNCKMQTLFSPISDRTRLVVVRIACIQMLFDNREAAAQKQMQRACIRIGADRTWLLSWYAELSCWSNTTMLTLKAITQTPISREGWSTFSTIHFFQEEFWAQFAKFLCILMTDPASAAISVPQDSWACPSPNYACTMYYLLSSIPRFTFSAMP